LLHGHAGCFIEVLGEMTQWPFFTRLQSYVNLLTGKLTIVSRTIDEGHIALKTEEKNAMP